MKKILCVGLMSVFCLGAMAGCAKNTEVDESTVFVQKKGEIMILPEKGYKRIAVIVLYAFITFVISAILITFVFSVIELIMLSILNV